MRVDEYIGVLEELARAGRPVPLARAIENRLRGSPEPVSVKLGGKQRQIVSPPLERDEPDRNLLLYTVFQKLRNADGHEAVENLRRAAIELFVEALNQNGDMEYLQAVARLVGHVRVSQSEKLRPDLEQKLYGFLDLRLPRPFDELVELDGELLERATVALDGLVAMVPTRPRCPQHYGRRLETVLEKSYERLKRGSLQPEPRLRFLFLAFRALVKVNPVVAGARWLGPLCRLVDRLADELPRARRSWLSLCRHQGVVFAGNEELRREFREGVLRMREEGWRELRRLELFRAALRRLDGLLDDEDVRRLLDPPEPPVLRIVPGRAA